MTLHQQHLTPTQQASLSHRMRFLQKINERAETNRSKPIAILPVKPISVPVPIKRWMSPEEQAFGPLVLKEPAEARLPSVKLIITIVAEFYEMSRIDLISDRRTANVVLPRQIAMYLARTLTIKSLPEIGRQMSKRDHTTVLHGVRKIERLLAIDERLADEIEVLKLHIKTSVFNS